MPRARALNPPEECPEPERCSTEEMPRARAFLCRGRAPSPSVGPKSEKLFEWRGIAGGFFPPQSDPRRSRGEKVCESNLFSVPEPLKKERSNFAERPSAEGERQRLRSGSEARGQVSRSESCPPSEARGEDARDASVRGQAKSAEGSFRVRSAGEARGSEANLRSEFFGFGVPDARARGRPRQIFHARRGALRGGLFSLSFSSLFSFLDWR